MYSDMDLGFEDQESMKKNTKDSNDLIKLDSKEGLAQYFSAQNSTRTPLLKKNVVEISRIPLQEAVKNGNGKAYSLKISLKYCCTF